MKREEEEEEEKVENGKCDGISVGKGREGKEEINLLGGDCRRRRVVQFGDVRLREGGGERWCGCGGVQSHSVMEGGGGSGRRHRRPPRRRMKDEYNPAPGKRRGRPEL